jgi:hypothetical protein
MRRVWRTIVQKKGNPISWVCVLAGGLEAVLLLVKVSVPVMLANYLSHCLRPLLRLARHLLGIAFDDDAGAHADAASLLRSGWMSGDGYLGQLGARYLRKRGTPLLSNTIS